MALPKEIILKQSVTLIADRMRRNDREIARHKKEIEWLKNDTLTYESTLEYTQQELNNCKKGE